VVKKIFLYFAAPGQDAVSRTSTPVYFLNSSFGNGPEFSYSALEESFDFSNTSVGDRPIDGIFLRTAVLGGVPVDQPNGSRQVFAKDDRLIW